jgi:DNA-binding response OmpR family regulator
VPGNDQQVAKQDAGVRGRVLEETSFARFTPTTVTPIEGRLLDLLSAQPDRVLTHRQLPNGQ